MRRRSGPWLTCYATRTMRFVLTHSWETRPSMLVRTCASIDEEEIRRFRDDMFGIGCATGLLFDSESCAILRDTFQSMTPDSNRR